MSDGCPFGCDQSGGSHAFGCPDELEIGPERSKRIAEFDEGKAAFALGLATSSDLSVAFRLGQRVACRERQQGRDEFTFALMIVGCHQ